MNIQELEQAENDGTPAPILKNLANSDSWEVREAVANHPNVLAKTLDTLSKDENDIVRHAVSLHRHTNAKTLTAMTSDENDDIKYNIAKHPESTLRVLMILANGKINEATAKTISQNKNANNVLQTKLSKMF